MYRRAHSCRQTATSRNVDFGPLFHPQRRRHMCDHRREWWHDPSVMGVVSPRRPKNDLRAVLFKDSKSTHSKIG